MNEGQREAAITKPTGLPLIAYGLLLAGLSSLAYSWAPELARPTWIVGLAGGGLCLAWGVRAVLGKQSPAPPLLTLLPVTFVLLAQTVTAWLGQPQDLPGRRPTAALLTVLLALTVGMILRLTQPGVGPVGPPGPPRPRLGDADAGRAAGCGRVRGG